MRTFIAIDFNSDVKKRIAELQKYFRSRTISGRWKYIENLHLTLKFLDEIDDRQLSEIDRALADICSNTINFNLEIKSLGYFPGKEAVRVLWLGMGGDAKRLGMLQADIDRGLEEIGFPKEKREYIPHITIGQDIVFDKRPEELVKAFEMPDFPKTAVDKVFLYKSEQIGNRRVYTSLREYGLKQL